MEDEKIYCANCGDIATFKLPNDCNWFCCQDCYDEYNNVNDESYFIEL